MKSGAPAPRPAPMDKRQQPNQQPKLDWTALLTYNSELPSELGPEFHTNHLPQSSIFSPHSSLSTTTHPPAHGAKPTEKQRNRTRSARQRYVSLYLAVRGDSPTTRQPDSQARPAQSLSFGSVVCGAGVVWNTHGSCVPPHSRVCRRPAGRCCGVAAPSTGLGDRYRHNTQTDTDTETTHQLRQDDVKPGQRNNKSALQPSTVSPSAENRHGMVALV